MTNKNIFFLACLVLFLGTIGCQKKDYFTDTGKHDPNYQGSVLSYLKSRPDYFDSIVKIIHLAGMDNVFDIEDITFFAPADSSVNATIEQLNTALRNLGEPRRNLHNRLHENSADCFATLLSC